MPRRRVRMRVSPKQVEQLVKSVKDGKLSSKNNLGVLPGRFTPYYNLNTHELTGPAAYGELFERHGMGPDIVRQKVGQIVELELMEMLNRVGGAVQTAAAGNAAKFLQHFVDGVANVGDLEQAHADIARDMQAALVDSYLKKVVRRKLNPSYYRENQNRYAGGALLRALASPKNFQFDHRGIQFMNSELLYNSARHWARLNFGAKRAAGAKGPGTQITAPERVPVFLWGQRAGTIGFSRGPRPAFGIPPGFFKGSPERDVLRTEVRGVFNPATGNKDPHTFRSYGSTTHATNFKIGNYGKRNLGRRSGWAKADLSGNSYRRTRHEFFVSGRRPFYPTRGISSANYVDDAFKRFAAVFPVKYTKLLDVWGERAARVAVVNMIFHFAPGDTTVN